MTEQVVYSTLVNGSDSAAIGGLIGYVLLAGLVSYLALRFRGLKKQGVSLNSSWARTTWLRTVLAKNALIIVVVLSLVGSAFGLLVWKQYQADRELLTSEAFQSISGSLTDYRAAEVRSDRGSHVDSAFGYQPNRHETDRLVIEGHIFWVTCDKPSGAPAASVGERGRCLNLHPGQQIKIDFVQLSPTQYKAEPLRITAIE